MMDTLDTLENKLLIAMPDLEDSHFSQAVVYIFEHSAEGTLGLTINKPLTMTHKDLFQQLDLPLDNPNLGKHPILQGGPMSPQHGFVLHGEDDCLYLSASLTLLGDIGRGAGPKHHLIALGQASWGPGQLMEEMADNQWLVGLPTEQLLFKQPHADRWQVALAQSGINLANLSTEDAHA